VRQFKLSRDPEFVPKLRDIVGLYIDPPAHAMVLSVDEKSQIQALDCTQPGLPLKPGRCGTMTHDYKKERHHDAVRRPRCARRQAHRPLHATPPASGIHPFPQRDRGRNPGRQDHPRDPRQLRPAQASQNPSLAGTASALRLPLHATSASWLNAVEGFFAKLGKRRLKRGVFCSIVDLQAAIHRFLRETNDDPKPFVWSADLDKIIAAVRRGAPSVRFDPNDLADPTRSAVMFEYRLEHVMSFYINAQFPEMIGPIPEGMQLNFYITGGEISGPKVVGKVRPVGGDWMTVRRDGVGILDIKGTLETQDGALIYATIDGTFDFGEDGYDKILRGWHPPSGAPFRASPRFRTAHPNYLWLNRGHFLAIGAAFTERLRIEYEIYAVL